MEQKIDIKKVTANIRLYTKYKMFAYDMLAFYSINIMYFTLIKGFSLAQVMYINASYNLSMVIWQFFASYIVGKLGLKKSIVTGNIFVILNCLIFIFANSMSGFFLGNFAGALGYSLKSISESSLLYSTLKYVRKRNEFSKIEGTSNSKYFYLDAFTALFTGILFVVNGYIPIIICTIFTIISLYISCKFYDLENTHEQSNTSALSGIKLVKDLFKSNRTKAMILFAFIFYGVISIVDTFYKSIALDINMQEKYVTIIVSIITIFVGFGSKFLYGIEKVTRNKTLTVFSYFLVASMVIISLVGIFNVLNITSLVIFMLALVIFGIIKGAYRVAMKKYVLSFTTHNMRNEITSVYYMAENFGTTIISILSGFVLEFTTNSIACFIFAVISFVVFTIVLHYMDGKIGLRPEQYDKSEINNVEV